MIAIKLQGGLGNQLSQYAFARSLAIKRNTSLVLDVKDYTPNSHRAFQLKDFNIKAKIGSIGRVPTYTQYAIKHWLYSKHYLLGKTYENLFLKVIGFDYYYDLLYYLEQENILSSISEGLALANNSYLIGFFHSEDYFIDIRNTLIAELTPKKNTISEKAHTLIQEIQNTENCVSIHVRGDDYLATPPEFYNLDSIYYNTAIQYLEQKFDYLTYYVFTDDIAHAKTVLSFLIEENKNQKIIFCSDEEYTTIETLWAMSKCNHNVIANSSFSWWGAWLNNNPNRIILAPEKWQHSHEKNSELSIKFPNSWIHRRWSENWIKLPIE